MARTSNENFLKKHYDKLLVGVSLAVLAATLWFLATGSSDADRTRTEFERAISSARLDKPAERLASDVFDTTLERFETPYRMTTGGAFLVAAERVACVSCRRPIRIDLDECPYCQAEQPTGEVSEDWDSDGDGIPDAVETAWGLNPRDPTDAEQDLDGDGFTNLEEFVAKTDSRDAGSHPPKFDFLRVSDIEVKKFPFVLKSHTESSRGVRFQFNRSAAGGQSYMLSKGDALAKTGYVLSDYSIAEEDVVVPGLGPRRKKLATVTLAKDKDHLFVKEGEPPVNGMYVVSFVCLKDPERTVYTAERGGGFEFDGETFLLDGIDQKAGSATVTRRSSKKTWTVPKE